MKKLTLVSMLFCAALATSAFAAEVDVDFDNLIPADEIEATAPSTAYGWDHHHEGFRCFAENGRGMRFEGFGEFPREAQERAMRECYEHSRHCRPMGCHRD